MTLARGILGAVLCTAGVKLATIRRPSGNVCRRSVSPKTKSVGRRDSERSAIEVYQFTPDAQTANTPTEVVLAEDNTVIGYLKAAVGPKSCASCVHFRVGACEGYPGFCQKLAEPTTTRGVCDLWDPREN